MLVNGINDGIYAINICFCNEVVCLFHKAHGGNLAEIYSQIKFKI